MPTKRKDTYRTNPSQAVIITALPVEYQAVRTHLDGLREEVHSRGTIYECGTFLVPGTEWHVAVVEIGPGNAAAALEAERAIGHFDPSVVLFVGVAGGLKDVKLGDVVAATRVYGYESGKAVATFLPRADVGNSSYRMLQRARAESKKPNWLQRLQPSPNPTPKVFVQPIAAGEKVVASRKSATYKFLRASYGDALAVEMEGRGFLAATAANDVEALIVRGISDLIQRKQVSDRAGFQEIAARNASAFAFEILANLNPRSDSVSSHDEIRWLLRLSGTIEQVDAQRATGILDQLREISKDAKLNLEAIQPGSVELLLRGTRAGFQRICLQFKSRRFTEISGLKVLGAEVTGEDAIVPKLPRDSTSAQSHPDKPSSFYTCFISYSSKDQAFAERLHADLQSKGVRCWFAPEDLKIGDKIRPAIDESIRTKDKLLLILSEHSVSSDWVEHEVETAMAREQEMKRTLLFPIRLDDTVMQIKTAWPAHIKNTRNIGDFRQWNDDDAYQKSFARLLRNLKASEAKNR